MTGSKVTDAIYWFSGAMVVVLVVILGFLVVLGLVNAIVVIARTLLGKRAEREGRVLPEGIVGMQAYLQLLADVLLVVVGIELIETLAAFLQRANAKVYLSGVVGAALVAIARRIVVFFNLESEQRQYGEVYAYSVLIAVLAAAYVAIRVFG